MNWTILVEALIGITTVGVAYLTVRITRKKSEAEGVEVITRTALSLIEPLEARVASLEREVEGLEVEVRLWRELANRRGDQVAAMGGVPVPFEALLKEFGGLNLSPDDS